MAIKMYRAKELPTTLTTAHDGLWYIKPDGNHPFKLYMVKGGVPYEGSFAPPNLQQITDVGAITDEAITVEVNGAKGSLESQGLRIEKDTTNSTFYGRETIILLAAGQFYVLNFPKFNITGSWPYIPISVNGVRADSTGDIPFAGKADIMPITEIIDNSPQGGVGWPYNRRRYVHWGNYAFDFNFSYTDAGKEIIITNYGNSMPVVGLQVHTTLTTDPNSQGLTDIPANHWVRLRVMEYDKIPYFLIVEGGSLAWAI